MISLPVVLVLISSYKTDINYHYGMQSNVLFNHFSM